MPWMCFTVKKFNESEYAINWQLSLNKHACDLVWFCSARGDNFWLRIKSPWRKAHKSPCKILVMNVPKCKLALKESQKWMPPSPYWLCSDVHIARKLSLHKSCLQRLRIYAWAQRNHMQKWNKGSFAEQNGPVKGNRPLKFQSVVLSVYEIDGINMWQYVTLKNHSQEDQLQLETAWFPRKH